VTPPGGSSSQGHDSFRGEAERREYLFAAHSTSIALARRTISSRVALRWSRGHSMPTNKLGGK